MALKHDTVTLQRLDAFQRECAKEGLAVEPAMAALARKTIRFIEAFEHGPRCSWSSYFGAMKAEAKLLKGALKAEFPEIKGPAQPGRALVSHGPNWSYREGCECEACTRASESDDSYHAG